MFVYTFQPKKLVDEIMENGTVAVDFEQTNLYQHVMNECVAAQNTIVDAYTWMARKLGEKTGIWFKDVYSWPANAAKDEDGNYIDEEGLRLPVFPFWGWYLTNGKAEKPGIEYISTFGPPPFGDDRELVLLTLNVPYEMVLLSDANAWYCVLEGRPCFDYESDQEAKESEFEKKIQVLLKERGSLSTEELSGEKGRKVQEKIDKLCEEVTASWDKIFCLSGRNPKIFFGVQEKRDIQAVFPYISKEWIVEVTPVARRA